MSHVKIYSVTEINAKVRHTLESEIASIGITGEISNLSHATSGHYYFSLKDPKAQIRCAFFLNSQKASLTRLSNGQQVLVYGKVSLYEPRGDYQFIVTHIQEYGMGLLYQQYLALKQKLEEQGLFNPANKKPIPKFPQSIAIITSPKGAALHDILSTLQRRYPLARSKLYASEVQGADAHLQLIKALNEVIKSQDADVIILARGGGSIEDLWAFNNEQLAYAIADCPIPIITGIGHETDFTIADFVSDFRAATPTAAAEKATPNQIELTQRLVQCQNRLYYLILQKLRQYQQTIIWFKRQLAFPEKQLAHTWQRLDYAQKGLYDATYQYLLKLNHQCNSLNKHLLSLNPYLKLQIKQEHLHYLNHRLFQTIKINLEKKQQQRLSLEKTLISIAPAATLSRGYAIVRYEDKILNSSDNIPIHGKIAIQLAKGELKASVESKS